MTTCRKVFYLGAALVLLSGASIFAQDHGSHGMAAAAPAAVRGSSFRGGTFVTPPHRGPHTPIAHRPATGQTHSNNRGYGYGYGYGWGAAQVFPYYGYYGYYDQPDAGVDNSDNSQDAQDNAEGPTIFEHNGRPSAYPDDRRSREEQAAAQPNDAPPEPATVLVFRDGHQQDVESYAIAGSKLIVLGARTQNIQLSDLDLNATAKANEDRGVDFKTPNQS